MAMLQNDTDPSSPEAAPMRTLTCVALTLIALLTSSAYAHSGGTDKNGCHRERATGTRHCH